MEADPPRLRPLVADSRGARLSPDSLSGQSLDAVALVEQQPPAVQAPGEAVTLEGEQPEQATARPSKTMLDDVFGDVLPDTTRDEADDGSVRSESGRDGDLLRNVPPHHG